MMKKVLMRGLRFFGMALTAWLCAMFLRHGAFYAEVSGYAWILPASIAVICPLLYWAYRVIWIPIQSGSGPSRSERLLLLVLLIAVIAIPSYQGVCAGRDLTQELSTTEALPHPGIKRFPSYMALRSDALGSQIDPGLLEFVCVLSCLVYVTLERARAVRLRKADSLHRLAPSADS